MVISLADFTNKKRMNENDLKKKILNDKLVLDSESYESLSRMLNSTEEDTIVALTCLNNVNQKDSLVYTLFLRKKSKLYYKMWANYCPKLIKYHESLGVSDKNYNIKYNTIIDIIEKTDNKEQNIEVFLKEFSKFLQGNLSKAFGFIDELEFVLKFKNKNE
jgi:thiol-disulfide isomerase/thioredoxin